MKTLLPPIHLVAILSIALVGFVAYALFSHAQDTEENYKQKRMNMVKTQIEARGVTNPKVLQALEDVPRHLFVPESHRSQAYIDSALPIAEGQTISQPYIVAKMTELIDPQPEDKVLEIGTGSGYQAAVLSRIVDHVFSIEIVKPLGIQANKLLEELGYENVYVRIGDGYQGWPAEAPFDKIIVTAAPPKIPQPLIDQLKEGGKMAVPVGRMSQELMLLRKEEGELIEERVFSVRFVPMTGEAQNN